MIIDLIREFRALEEAISTLNHYLTKSAPNHWIPLTETEIALGMQPLELATDLIADLWYRNQGDGRETRSRHGLILADATTQQLIQQVNQQKQAFREQVNLEKQDKSGWRRHYQELSESPSELREKLVNVGLKRVHLKQCFRLLPLLEFEPQKVGFSWYVSGRSIKNISLSQAEKMLLEFGEDKPHIQAQLSILGQLSPGTRLAQVQQQAPVVRANLVFSDTSPIKRKAMNLALPLFIPVEDAQQPLPTYNSIAPEAPPGRTRQARADQKISDEPLLPSLRAHTYR
ncbi:MAG: DNA replication terminus site-binding protein [Oceanobacter sp.]